MPAKSLQKIAEEKAIGSPAVWLLVHKAIKRFKKSDLRRQRRKVQRIEAVKNGSSGSTRGRPRLEVANERAIGSSAVFLCVRAAIKAVKKKRHFREYVKERTLSDAHFAAETRCRNRLRNAMLRVGHGKASNTMELVGCTSKELVDHLGAEQWSKRHELDLVIDHIWPVNAYDLEDPEQQQMCFNFRNLRLCSSTENSSKSDQIPDQQLRNLVPRHLWPFAYQLQFQ
jgi:hypothetical protein